MPKHILKKFIQEKYPEILVEFNEYKKEHDRKYKREYMKKRYLPANSNKLLDVSDFPV